MLKSIPKSNISRRSFKVYKKFNTSETTYPVIKAYNVDGLFDSDTSPVDEGLFVHLLYQSIKAKYYTDNGLLNNYGSFSNPAEFTSERILSDTTYVVSINQSKIGEKIKPGSVLVNIDGIDYIDNGVGKITKFNPTYQFSEFDIENNLLTIVDGVVEYDITISSIDLETGLAILTFNGDTDGVELVSMDFDSETITFLAKLNFSGMVPRTIGFGNVFYSDGLLIFNDIAEFTEYNLEYRSTQTIHETEILLEANAGEFNYSQNPSAVNITLSGSYDFTTTPISNSSSAKTVKIKEVQDISLRNEYNGTIGTNVGTWDDYSVSSSMDPTGSFLAPMISTIGIYDSDGDMVAVAKLPQPIKNLPDYDVNFIVRFDT
jgi:hypothetical protein